MADLVIKDVTIVDGMGAPARIGDVAVTGDTITEVGSVEAVGGARVVS